MAVALSSREREILQLVAEGHPNAGVARRLWVTEKTVKFHLTSIYRKLAVSNRTEASRWARQRGFVADEPGPRLALFFGAGVGARVQTPPQRGGGRLTLRERQILRLVAEGCSNRQIADELCISEPTVKFHLSNIYRKLSVTNRTEASRYVRRDGRLSASAPVEGLHAA